MTEDTQTRQRRSSRALPLQLLLFVASNVAIALLLLGASVILLGDWGAR